MNKVKRNIYKFLSTERWNDSAIFFLRIFVGVMMLIHGFTKIQNYDSLFDSFPDPIGWGSNVSLILITSIEVIGSALLIVGFLVRPAAIALALGMTIATFAVSPGGPLANELSFVYLGIYVALTICGGARYSLDRLLFKVK